MAPKVCECCGQILPDLFDEVAKSARLTRSEAAIFLAVAASNGRTVTHGGIISHMWGGDPDGGPMTADNLIKVFVHRLNKKLVGTGYRVRSVWGEGYCLALTGDRKAA